jgi:hypothetical protein
MSGCTISWDFFHGDKEIPLLLRYLEDRDIWRWVRNPDLNRTETRPP